MAIDDGPCGLSGQVSNVCFSHLMSKTLSFILKVVTEVVSLCLTLDAASPCSCCLCKGMSLPGVFRDAGLTDVSRKRCRDCSVLSY